MAAFYNTNTGALVSSGHTPLYESPEFVGKGWILVSREQHDSIKEILRSERVWTGSEVREMTAQEKQAIKDADDEASAGSIIVDWNMARLTLNQLTQLFSSPSPKQQRIIDVVSARKAQLRTKLAALGLSVPK